jgi:hypothetical protein
VLAGLGVPGFDDAFGLARSDRVVLHVIDGLGAYQLREYAEHAPFLASMTQVSPSIDAAFPTTTPTGLTSIGTGLSSGEHGVVGAAFRYEQDGPLLRPLHWGNDPAPADVQVNATVWEQAAWSRVHVAQISPRQYHDSGLTSAALRGAHPVGGDSPGEVSTAVGVELRKGTSALVYAYHPTLDRTGHIHGAGSDPWLADLAHVDLLARATAAALPTGATMYLTADHGMVNVEPSGRVDLTADPLLLTDVDQIAGEPRMRALYVRRGAVDDVVRRWSDRIGHAAWVLAAADAIAAGWFGDVDEDVVERIGDVLAVAKPGHSLLADFDRRTGHLIGQHGSLTAEEVAVPLLTVRA